MSGEHLQGSLVSAVSGDIGHCPVADPVVATAQLDRARLSDPEASVGD